MRAAATLAQADLRSEAAGVSEFTVLEGDVLDVLTCIPSESVHCVVTSPPYWGLRDYGIEPSVWGGDRACDHEWGSQERGRRGDILPAEISEAGRLGTYEHQTGLNDGGRFCKRCEAWRGCLGLEPTPSLFVEHIVEVFRQVRRVLHPTGVLWLNMGDSYITEPHAQASPSFDPKYQRARDRSEGISANRSHSARQSGLKSKDLVMMPARVALALQADGWYLRDQVPWVKHNGMPGSQKDRPTSMVEYVYLLSKSESYFYDVEAGRLVASGAHDRGHGINPKAMGPNSRMRVDRDPAHQTPAKTRAKQNRSFSAAVKGLVGTRVRRNADWFFESIREVSAVGVGAMLAEDLGPLAFVVNPQPFLLEMCDSCEEIYDGKSFRALARFCVQCWETAPPDAKECNSCENQAFTRKCTCGKTTWVSHFATFSEHLVRPMIQLGSSQAGCCPACLSPYVRIVERPKVGNWNPQGDSQKKGCVAKMANWTKVDRPSPERDKRIDGYAASQPPGRKAHSISQMPGAHDRIGAKISPDGDQFSHTRASKTLAAAREKTGDHDIPFPAPQTLGFAPTCICHLQ
ncbi:MAG TPA: DNA methyltransferase, partial [Terriglobia bacterium]|nr:DNA methyltransferase [Terriglobia bacterium]